MNGWYKMDGYLLSKTHLYKYTDAVKWVKQALSYDKMSEKLKLNDLVFKTTMGVEEGKTPYNLKVEIWKKKTAEEN